MTSLSGRAGAFVVALAAMLSGACGGDAGDGDRDAVLPVVAEIEPAIEAVEATLGGPQRYVEINATSRLVNLFVAVGDDGSGNAVPYLYVDGELQPPAPPVPVDDMPTFTAADVDFAPDEVLDAVVRDLPNSTFGMFVVTAGDGVGVRYEVFVQSTQGGALAVNVAGDGGVLGVERLDPT